MKKVIHTSNHPVMAIHSIKPVVDYLENNGYQANLWIEFDKNQQDFKKKIKRNYCEVKLNFTLNPFRYYKLYKLLKVEKPEILHSHACRASLLPLFCGFLAKVPIRIYHNHGMPYLGYTGILKLILKSIEKINIFFSTHMIAVSQGNKEEAVKDGLAKDSYIKIIGNGSACGVDLDKVKKEEIFNEFLIEKNKKKFNINSKKLCFLYVGRPFKRKGFHLALTAFRKSNIGNLGHTLLIAGCSKEDCIDAVGEISNGIIPLGFVDDIYSIMYASDVIMLPSFHEGFPNIFLEGAALGKALLGSDIPGIKNAIISNESGLLVPVGDEKKLSDSLKYLVNNKSLVKKMGLKARYIVETKFDRISYLKNFVSYYQSLFY